MTSGQKTQCELAKSELKRLLTSVEEVEYSKETSEKTNAVNEEKAWFRFTNLLKI